MKVKNYNLLNDAMEQFWDLESMIRLFAHLQDSEMKIPASSFDQVSELLSKLRNTCIKLAD